MKKLSMAIISFVICAAASVTACAQGTVVFANFFGTYDPDAAVYESDGVTPCVGPQFRAELFAGPSVSSMSSIAMVGFAGPSQAGYFFDGVQTINSVAPGSTAWIQVDVWNTASGATFTAAKDSGLPNSWWQSAIFTVQIVSPPAFPTRLTGLGESPVFLNSVPEPSIFAFAALGMALVAVRSRTH
jgi:hypothetical protein